MVGTHENEMYILNMWLSIPFYIFPNAVCQVSTPVAIFQCTLPLDWKSITKNHANCYKLDFVQRIL